MIRVLVYIQAALVVSFFGSNANAQGNLPDLPPMGDRFEQSAPKIGELLPDLVIFDDKGAPVSMRELPVRGRYTVLVVGCLT